MSERNKEREKEALSLYSLLQITQRSCPLPLFTEVKECFCLPLIISLFLCVCLSLSPRLCHGSMYHSLDYSKPLVSPAQGMCKLTVTPCLAYKVGPHFSPNKYR